MNPRPRLERCVLGEKSEMREKRAAGGRRESWSTWGMREDEKRKTNEVRKRVRERIEY